MLNEVLTGTQNNSDGLIVKARGTRDGAQVMQSMHGPYYEAALRGNVFHASTVIAGKVVLVAAATLGGVFTIHNPAGSNRNVELISFAFGIDSATIVVNTVGLLIQRYLIRCDICPFQGCLTLARWEMCRRIAPQTRCG